MPGNICVNELFQFVCIVIKGHDCNNNVLIWIYNTILSVTTIIAERVRCSIHPKLVTISITLIQG